jgi:hypothetical protein
MERVSEAAKVMQSFGNTVVITSAIRRSELQEIFQQRYAKRKNAPIGLREPDYFCFIAYAASALAQLHKKWPEAEILNFVVSHKKTVTHHVGTFAQEVRMLIKPPLQGLVGELIPEWLGGDDRPEHLVEPPLSCSPDSSRCRW